MNCIKCSLRRSVNVLPVHVSGNTFLSNFMFGTSIIVQLDYCLAMPTYPAPGLFITRSLQHWFRPTGTVLDDRYST